MYGKKKILLKNNICEVSQTSSCSDSSSSPCGKSSNSSCSSSSSSCSDSSSSCCPKSPKILIVEPSNCSSRSDCRGCKNCKKPKKGCGYGGGYGGACGGGCSGGCGGGCGGMLVKGYGNCNSRFGNSFTPYCGTPYPVSDLRLLKGNSCGTVPFYVSINCRSVTLQWDGFSGRVDSSGAAYIYINQCFSGLPKFNVFGSYLINLKGTDFLSVVEINPDNSDTIRWYFYPTRKGTSISKSDSFTVYPGSISYVIVEECC